MKKILFALTVLTVALFCLPVSAQSENAFLVTLRQEDMSGSNYQLYMTNCSGHYDAQTDSVTLYIGNVSDKEADFEVCVGWSGNDPVTFVQSGAVTIKPGQMGKFVLTGLYDFPERSNNELGYVPGSHLSGSSVIRILVSNAKEGMSFVLAGMNSFGGLKNSGFKDAREGFVRPLGQQNVDGARLVVADEESADQDLKITLEVPETEKVQTFLTIAVSSAVLCAGGLILFIVRYFIREKKNDRTEQV